MKINIGSASKKIEGFKNVDIRPDQDVYFVSDLTELPWHFAILKKGSLGKSVTVDSESIDTIIAEEFFEHIEWRRVDKLSKEIYRVLIPGGVMSLTVPDIGKMCEYYVRGQICDCVPHKEPVNGFKADPDCKKCKGKAKINPERFKQAISGAQKHEWDIHRSHHFKAQMMEMFRKTGFEVTDASPDNWYKIKLKVIK